MLSRFKQTIRSAFSLETRLQLSRVERQFLTQIAGEHGHVTVCDPDSFGSGRPDRREQFFPISVIGNNEPSIKRLPATRSANAHPSRDKSSRKIAEPPCPGCALCGRRRDYQSFAPLSLLRRFVNRRSRRQIDTTCPVFVSHLLDGAVCVDRPDR